jgi:hypothetical protein
MIQHRFPRRTIKGLSIQQVGEETLVYDERRHVAFCLDRVASAVWMLCDGENSLDSMAPVLTQKLAQPVDEDALLFALAQMERDGLLQPEEAAAELPTLGMLSSVSRRSMMARMGAGAVMMLPVIAAVMAPKAAQAYNGCADCTDAPVNPIGGDSGRPESAPKPDSGTISAPSSPEIFPEIFK